MIYLWKFIRTTLAIIGFILILGATGTSDYYLLELRQPEPEYVETLIQIGIFMWIPLLLEILFKEWRKTHQ